ncbi:MAG: NADH-dependent flavin oxidoreductase [Pseudomonadota bacterium]
MSATSLFSALNLANLPLRNRIAMAPMTTWAANSDLTISDAEAAYYRRRVGAVGLVLTGCTQVMPNGIGFTDEFAATDDSYLPSLNKLAKAAKSGGAPAILQLFHAGAKALPDLTPHREVIAASAIPTAATIFAPAQTPRALLESEIHDLIAAFGQATRRAIEAGFDGVELHGAHGFLLQNFFSPASNQRTDQWGGSVENRMRFALSVVAEVKRVITAHASRPFALGYRISTEEPGDNGYSITDSLTLLDHLISAGIDYIHVSLGNVLTDRPLAEPNGAPIAARFVARAAGRIAVIAAGGLRTPQQAEQALALGLSVVAVGKGLVMNPDWVELAQTGRADEIETSLDPAQITALAIPEKLWAVIDAMPGWFSLTPKAKRSAAASR